MLPSELIGTTLRDKWRIDALIGEGGMAKVYAATHRNGSRGALKILHAHLCADPRMRARFVREGYVANKVIHPGAVRVIDDDVTEDGRVFLVMELLDGTSWKQRWALCGRQLPATEVVAVGLEVLDVLEAAHRAGVVHRDVKPDNVFLLHGGGVKLVDFGIARLRDATSEATLTGSMLGTPAFMPPEQALSHWDDVDSRSDLFALGATIRMLITGRLVHDATTVNELLVAAATRQAKPFETVSPGAPRELCEALDRALRFERSERWQDAAAMRAALVQAQAALARAPLLQPEAVGLDAANEDSKPTLQEAAVVPTQIEIGLQRTHAATSTDRSRGSRKLVIGALGAVVVGVTVFVVATSQTVENPQRPVHASVTPSADTSSLPIAPLPPEPGCVKEIFAGPRQTCAVRRDGRTYCWGDNRSGLLAPAPKRVDRPALLDGILHPTALSFGQDAAIAVAQSRLLGWGKNTWGALGKQVPIDATTKPIDLGLDDVVSASTNGVVANTCATTREGSIMCWGLVSPVLGEALDVSAPRLDPTKLPYSIAGWLPTSIRVGGTSFACASLAMGDHSHFTCWGNPTPQSEQVTAGKSSALAAGRSVSWQGVNELVAASDRGACRVGLGGLECWGACGADPVSPRKSRHLPSPALSLAGGLAHYCAALQDGSIACWGGNARGQSGREPFSDSCEPKSFTPPFRAEQLALGWEHSCALERGHVHCWGSNGQGQRGCGGAEPVAASCHVEVPCN